MTDYINSVRDTDYSFSVSYYTYIDAEIKMETGFGAAAVLTLEGMKNYQSGANPDFGLICGDQYIDSYSAGVILITTIKMELANSVAKDNFTRYWNKTFGSF